jgi:hydrogenase 3 maturation protease
MDNSQTLHDRLKELFCRDTLIVGIGNTLKGDDGAGSVICQRLKKSFPDRIIDTGSVPENFIQPIIDKSPEVLLIIDATDFGESAGAIEIFSLEQISRVTFSTHCLSPRLFLDVICQSISPEIYFLGIQPGQTELNQPLSLKVSKAVDVLVETFSHLLNHG